MNLIPVLFGIFFLYITRTDGQTIIVEQANIKYTLYNSNNRATPVPINITSLPDNGINTDIKTVFLTHGWLDGPDINLGIFPEFVFATKEAYFDKGITNIVVVDWSYYAAQFATSYTYIIPFLQTRAVGECVGQMVIAMATKYGLKYDKFHLVGHSLGAHISGFAGKYITDNTTNLVGRITGLDPAGPGYYPAPPTERLAVTDGVLVDAIHTSSDLGYWAAIGDVDFYPNGGDSQPGCSLLPCSHQRAFALFTESVKTGNFKAWACTVFTITLNNLLSVFLPNSCCTATSSLNEMGENVSASNPGVFYLSTKKTSLYAKGNVC